MPAILPETSDTEITLVVVSRLGPGGPATVAG